MPSDDSLSHSRRVRVLRKRALTERIAKRLSMPHLTRWKRNERIAIVVIFTLAVIYFIAAPMIDQFYSSGPSRSSPAAAAPGTSGPPVGKAKVSRPDRRGP